MQFISIKKKWLAVPKTYEKRKWKHDIESEGHNYPITHSPFRMALPLRRTDCYWEVEM